MSDGPRYQMRKGERTRIVDVVEVPSRRTPVEPMPRPTPTPAPAPMPRTASAPPPRRFAHGSTPALPAAEMMLAGDELEELAPPTRELKTLGFGGHTIIVEHAEGRVELSLPGALRLIGTPDQVERLIAALRSR